jgi:hypothetical protein
MRFKFQQPDWRSVRRRLCAGVTLLAYLCAAIGFPMPKANACGQQVCGCATAQTCQTGGCCCSPAKPAKSEEAVPSCCVKKKPAKPTCCTNDATTKTNNPMPVGWVIGITAQKCQGSATHWISAQAALPGPTPADWRPSWPYCHDVVGAREFRLLLSIDPLDPPPRFSAG